MQTIDINASDMGDMLYLNVVLLCAFYVKVTKENPRKKIQQLC